MTEAGSVTIPVRGVDVNLDALLTRLEVRMRQTDATGRQLAGVFGTTMPAAQQRSVSATLAQIGGLERGATVAQQFGTSMQSSLLGMVGPAAAATAAIGAVVGVVNSFGDAFNFKAQLDGTTASINSQLAGVRDMAVVWSEAASTARTFRLTQADTNAILASSVDVLRNSKASVGELEIALLRLGSRDPSKPISEAARALRELNSGDVTTIKEIFNVGAQDALRMKNEIQGGADAVQVLTRFLDQAGSGMNILEQRTTGALGAMNELAVAQEEMALAQARFAEGPGLVILEGKISVIRGATRLLSGDFDAMGQSLSNAFIGTSGGIDALQANLSEMAAQLAAIDPSRGAALQAVTDQILQIAATSPEAATNMQGLAGSFAANDINAQQLQIVLDATQASIIATAAASLQSGDASIYQSQAMIQASAASQAFAAAVNVQTAEIQASAQASVADGIAKQTQAAATELLDFKTRSAVDAFLLLHPNITAAGAALLVTAGQVPPLIAQLALLQKQAIDSANALAFLRGGGPQGTVEGRAERDTIADRAEVGSNKALEANRQLLASIGRVGRATTSGGRARISEQAKLSNALLTQQQTADNRLEDAERAHQQRLLDIDQEFAKRSLAQQRTNEVGKRQSRADFYDSLTSATEDVGQEVATQLSASYEDAYARAQQIAQAGNQKLAADYLALKQSQIQAELDFQRRIAEAAANKDKAEVDRLSRVHQLQADANAEQEKQLLEGGDANVAAREQALLDETQKFAESQDKIITAADRAAAAKVAAAQRSGKAVTDENLALAEQERILNRIGTRAGAPAVAPGAAPAGTTATVTPAAIPGAPIDLAAIQAGLDAVRAAIDGMSGAVTGAQRETTGAVRGLGGRLVT